MNATSPVETGGNTWAGFPVSEAGDVDTGAWLGFINVGLGNNYVWSYSLNQYLYIDEAGVSDGGSWVYVFNF